MKKHESEINAIVRENKDLATSEIMYRYAQAKQDAESAEEQIDDFVKRVREARKVLTQLRIRVKAFESLVEGRR